MGDTNLWLSHRYVALSTPTILSLNGENGMKSHLHRWELHMVVPLVKLPLGKCENTNTNDKEFRDCATTFASFYTVKAVWRGKNDRKLITLIFHFEVCIVPIIVIVYFSSFDQSYWLLLPLLFSIAIIASPSLFQLQWTAFVNCLSVSLSVFLCLCYKWLLMCITPIGILSYLPKFPSEKNPAWLHAKGAKRKVNFCH